MNTESALRTARIQDVVKQKNAKSYDELLDIIDSFIDEETAVSQEEAREVVRQLRFLRGGNS